MKEEMPDVYLIESKSRGRFTGVSKEFYKARFVYDPRNEYKLYHHDDKYQALKAENAQLRAALVEARDVFKWQVENSHLTHETCASRANPQITKINKLIGDE